MYTNGTNGTAKRLDDVLGPLRALALREVELRAEADGIRKQLDGVAVAFADPADPGHVEAPAGIGSGRPPTKQLMLFLASVSCATEWAMEKAIGPRYLVALTALRKAGKVVRAGRGGWRLR